MLSLKNMKYFSKEPNIEILFTKSKLLHIKDDPLFETKSSDFLTASTQKQVSFAYNKLVSIFCPNFTLNI